MRRKLMVLDPCGITLGASARIDPRFSDGRTNPSPIRPRIVCLQEITEQACFDVPAMFVDALEAGVAAKG